ncbi:MAG TPA: SpoIIE family protein phosphatase [Pseudomonadales bacterium]|nr:SpoIIE family protein phosphatase [Pseudomonadales bacterium]
MTVVFLLDAEVTRRQHLAHSLREAYEVHEYAHVPEVWNLGEPASAFLVLADLFLFKPESVIPDAAALVVYAEQADACDVLSAFRQGADDFLAGDLVNSPDKLPLIQRALEKKQRVLDSRHRLERLEQDNQTLTVQLNALKADQESGHLAQLMLLPPSPWEFGSCQLSHRIIPSLCLSGDFIDYFAIDETRFGFLLADVAGHGVSSAFVTVLLKYVMNTLCNDKTADAQQKLSSPVEVFKRINNELITMAMGKHVAMIYGVIDQATRTLEFSVAAHYPLPILKDKGAARFIGGGALPLGLFEDIQMAHFVEKLDDDFSLIMFSDGIMHNLPHENLSAKERYLLEMVDKGCDDMESISSHLRLNGIKDPEDDIGVLVVRGK